MKAINSDKAPEPVGAYPHAKRVGNLLFLSGVGPRKKGSKEIPGVTLDAQGKIVSYDIATQCHSVFENVKNILEASGASWGDLVDVTVYLTNMKDDFPIYNKLWAEYFANNPQGRSGPDQNLGAETAPCRTTLEINCLPTPIAIELKCIAALKENK